jgi:hypothetical protein
MAVLASAMRVLGVFGCTTSLWGCDALWLRGLGLLARSTAKAQSQQDSAEVQKLLQYSQAEL